MGPRLPVDEVSISTGTEVEIWPLMGGKDSTRGLSVPPTWSIASALGLGGCYVSG